MQWRRWGGLPPLVWWKGEDGLLLLGNGQTEAPQEGTSGSKAGTMDEEVVIVDKQQGHRCLLAPAKNGCLRVPPRLPATRPPHALAAPFPPHSLPPFPHHFSEVAAPSLLVFLHSLLPFPPHFSALATPSLLAFLHSQPLPSSLFFSRCSPSLTIFYTCCPPSLITFLH